MKKIIYLIGSLMMLVSLLVACGTNESTKNDSSIKEKKQTSVAEGIRFTISQPKKEKKQELGKEKILYTFQVKGENVSSNSKGLGSIDFVLETTDRKEVDIDPTMATFGDELKPTKSLSGPVTFSLNKTEKPKKLIYKLGDKKTAEWDVKE
ncbi:DUF4352 domain-containing protein [Candidatus Enterococcus courvalinii]|uniref:DUF4352 domain-containing protein n=1 Tax=Candidatus Enterococcus courvalinii TaxID=2815329 RepID=A0ABS3HYT1_9ENTE|nr:DUF4352 domain-containing protein [Enterococcus sp. MSG2901]MBO0481018.1 DUF4352 domain-containing protein [Enterococcus sp. MSG2901]